MRANVSAVAVVLVVQLVACSGTKESPAPGGTGTPGFPSPTTFVALFDAACEKIIACEETEGRAVTSYEECLAWVQGRTNLCNPPPSPTQEALDRCSALLAQAPCDVESIRSALRSSSCSSADWHFETAHEGESCQHKACDEATACTLSMNPDECPICVARPGVGEACDRSVFQPCGSGDTSCVQVQGTYVCVAAGKC